MKTHLFLISLFYRSFCSFSIIISLGIWSAAGSPLGRAFWVFLPKYILIKVITDLLIWRYSRSYNPDSLFFYANLGLSETRLFLTSFLVDIMIFFLFVMLVNFTMSIL